MVFKGSTEEMHVNAEDGMAPGHPVHTFKSENEEIKGKIGILFDKIENGEKEGLREGFEDLIKIEKHYSRKKNIIIFPLLEKLGIYGLHQVIWSVDDEVRSELKENLKVLKNEKGDDKNEKCFQPSIKSMK